MEKPTPERSAPADRGEATSAAKAASTPGPASAGILVVDDDATVRAMLDMGLRHSGFRVWQAADGAEALGVYRRHAADIDAVLLDVRMPGLDGPQTLAALRQLNPQVCCCFISGEIGQYTQDQLLAMGAAYFFKKPFSLAEITQTLRQLLGR